MQMQRVLCDLWNFNQANFDENPSICEQLQKFCEHEHPSTCLNFARKSSKGQILRAVGNFYDHSIPLPRILKCGRNNDHNGIISRGFTVAIKRFSREKALVVKLRRKN